MGAIGIREILFVLVVVVLIFGAKRIPQIAAGLGSGIRNFKGSLVAPPSPELSGPLAFPVANVFGIGLAARAKRPLEVADARSQSGGDLGDALGAENQHDYDQHEKDLPDTYCSHVISLRSGTGGESWAPSATEQVLCDGLKLHVAGSLVDRPDLGVPVQLLDRVLPGETVPAVQVDAQ